MSQAGDRRRTLKLDLRQHVSYEQLADGSWRADIPSLGLQAEGATREAAWGAVHAVFASRLGSDQALRARLHDLMLSAGMESSRAEYDDAVREAFDAEPQDDQS